MLGKNPLANEILFHVGPVPIAQAVVTTWVLMALITLVSWLVMRRARVHPGTAQAALEVVVETIANQIQAIIRRDPWPFMPLLGTLFIFLIVANLSAIIPGAKAPTAHIETPAALALLVFVAAHAYGIRARGVGDYLKRYVRPSPFLLPLNILSEITRTFSLMIRLFGNMMSHEFVVAIVVFLAGLLLPIPFMLLGILIGIIQAYIFTVLAAVFVGAAVGSVEAG
jgi:F-type H+-transporting ATPase subunit a